MHRRFAPLAVLAVLLACPAAADETLVLKDGRRIVVTRLARRAGKVRFETKEGKVFEVPEDQVVSPPLDQIPSATPPATAAPAPAPAAPPAQPAPEEPQVLALKDGRKINVRRLVRRGNLVLFETTKGERFSVPQDQVLAPPLASIPSLERPAPAPAPRPAPPKPAPQPPPKPAPAAPPPPAEPPPAPRTPPLAKVSMGEDEFVPYPYRWDILDQLPPDPRIVRGRTSDPYNQNKLKGDKPIAGDSTFLVLTATFDSPFEARQLPVVGGVSTADPGEFEFFGRGKQYFTTPRAFLSAELFGGQTAFKPKDWALKVTSALNLNYVRVQERNLVTVDVRDDKSRRRQDFSLEEAFGELRLATLSPNYDFVSVRAGIQPFVSDFRGLVFSDFNLGARLFGSAGNNRWQYNAAYFDLLEKETNSELNTFEKREQKVLVANFFRQDTFALGYTLSGSFLWSKDDANFHYDANGVLARPAPVGRPRPHEVRSKYAGLAGDGHFGRLNVSHAFYWAFGDDELNVVAGREVKVRAQLAALEASIDKDWSRFKLSVFWASGDKEPRDETAKGFDSIYDNSNFAGGPFSFWSRSAIALLQTKVLLKPPLTLLPSLRSNKFEGQSNFVNPGLRLAGLGVDLELTPKLKAVMNANYLEFDTTAPLETLLFQPNLPRSIGLDLGCGVVYRPKLNENIVITSGLTGLVTGKGFDAIFSSEPCGTPGCGFPSRNLYNGFIQVRLTY
jgi:hypothetical protein